VDLHGFHLDPVSQPSLKCALDQKLGSCGQLIAGRGEDKLEEAAAEIRPIDPFPGCSEKYLLDQVPDVIFIIRYGGASSVVKSVWEIDIHLALMFP
jgi:hypothetical protein